MKTMEEIITELFDASLRGYKFYHLMEDAGVLSFTHKHFYIRTDYENHKIFKHVGGPEAFSLPCHINLHQAAEIVKKYWHMRIHNGE